MVNTFVFYNTVVINISMCHINSN